MNTIEIFKTNVANIGSRAFGEIFAQTIVRSISTYKGMTKSNVEEYDEDWNGQRVEVKFARATVNDIDTIGDHNFKEYLFDGLRVTKFYSTNDRFKNIICQAIHPEKFDILVFGFVFDEGMYIFNCTSEEFLTDKQLAIGTKADGGWQFATTPARFRYFKENYNYDFLNWEELTNILTQ